MGQELKKSGINETGFDPTDIINLDTRVSEIPMAGRRINNHPVNQPVELIRRNAEEPSGVFSLETVYSMGITIVRLNQKFPLRSEELGLKLASEELNELLALGKEYTVSHPALARKPREIAGVVRSINYLINHPETREYLRSTGAANEDPFRMKVLGVIHRLSELQLKGFSNLHIPKQ